MMLYVIYDKVACESGPIFEAKNDSVAFRDFTKVIQKDPINPADFELLRIGSIDHETNILSPEDPEPINLGIDLVLNEEEYNG